MSTTNSKLKWYVVHTYSGYENKVKANIEKLVETHGMQEVIVDIRVPLEEVIEIKEDVKKVTQRKLFPGYVLIKMMMTDESWYVVRNTRGVTGFVGPASKPVPLTEEEVLTMGVEKRTINLSFDLLDNVRINSGPLENFVGIVEEINLEKGKVRVVVSMFGRDTPVELDFDQVSQVV